MTKEKKVSVIVPVYNEEEGIKLFLDEGLLPVVKGLEKYDYEVILVNDGSADGTLRAIQKLAEGNEKIQVISFTRNFGKEMALTAGLNYATGDAVISLDADGQHPTRLIPEFVKKWEKGAEIVSGIRSEYQKHGMVQKVGSKLFYKLLRLMGNKTMMPGLTDFRLMDKEVVAEFNKLSEHNRITRGLIDWMGFKQEYIEYAAVERIAGKPSYSLKKLFHLALDSFVSMSTTPLMIFGYLGVLITIGGFILGMFCIIQQHIMGDPLGLRWNGSLQLAIFITFLIGLLMISQSVVGMYVSHIYADVQGRPLYIVDKKASRNIKKESWEVK